MKLALIATALIALAPSPVSARGAADAAPPAPATLTLDLPIAELAADPRGKAVIDADFPGLTTHPMYDSFKSMTLMALQPMAGGKITDAQIAKAKADLAAIR